MPVSPWAQSLLIDWRPWLSYWERRIKLLRELDDAFDLTDFKLEPTEAGARWGNGSYELSITPDRLTVRGSGVDAERTVLLRAASLAVERLKPFFIGDVRVALAHVVPSDEPSSQLQEAAASELYDSWAPPVNVKDYAVILDGTMKDDRGAAHLEIGIVSKAELPRRLSGLMGQVPAGTQQAFSWWTNQKLPESAFYIGSVWTWDTGEENPGMEQIGEFWDTCIKEADACVKSAPPVAKGQGDSKEQGS
jgi:hypothetical protein